VVNFTIAGGKKVSSHLQRLLSPAETFLSGWNWGDRRGKSPGVSTYERKALHLHQAVMSLKGGRGKAARGSGGEDEEPTRVRWGNGAAAQESTCLTKEKRFFLIIGKEEGT